MAFVDFDFDFECGCPKRLNPFKILMRFGKLLLSIWMIGDMIMDAVTNKNYYDIAQVNVHECIKCSWASMFPEFRRNSAL